jgi:hypothetical protein
VEAVVQLEARLSRQANLEHRPFLADGHDIADADVPFIHVRRD